MGTSDRDAEYYMNFLEEYEEPSYNPFSYDSQAIDRLLYERFFNKPPPSPEEHARRMAQSLADRQVNRAKKRRSSRTASFSPQVGTPSSTNHSRSAVLLVPSITPADRDATVPPLSVINDQPSCLDPQVPHQLTCQSSRITSDISPIAPKLRRARLRKKRWQRQMLKNPNKKPRHGNRRKRRTLRSATPLNAVLDLLTSHTLPPVTRKKRKCYKPRKRSVPRRSREIAPDAYVETDIPRIFRPPSPLAEDAFYPDSNHYTYSFPNGYEVRVDDNDPYLDYYVQEMKHLTSDQIDRLPEDNRAYAAMALGYKSKDMKLILHEVWRTCPITGEDIYYHIYPPVVSLDTKPKPVQTTITSSFSKASSSKPTLTARPPNVKGFSDRGSQN